MRNTNELGTAAGVRGGNRIEDLLAIGRSTIRGSDVTLREVRELLGAISGLDSTMLYAYPELELGSDASAQFRAGLTRLLAGEPLAYLTGYREFFGRRFLVTTDTLVPRPETECLVALALRQMEETSGCAVLDLGTGTGAIILTLAAETAPIDRSATAPHRFTAVDRSTTALDVARTNAGRLGVTEVSFHHGDWFAPLDGAQFDIIVSNPPYVESDFEGLSGALRFEPASALAAGSDGLDDIRRIIADAPRHLTAGGWLALEHAPWQGRAVRALMEEAGLVAVATSHDLGERERVTHARKPGTAG